MRKGIKILVLSLPVILASLAFGQNYSGTFVLSSGGVTLTLVLQLDGQGNMAGTLSSTKWTQFQIPDYSKAKNLEFTRQSAGDTAGRAVGKNPLASPEAKETAQNNLAQKAQKDPFIGTFSGRTFPVKAQKKRSSSIEGTFESSGTAFPFSATLTSDVMQFSTEGTQYALQKQAEGQAPERQIESQSQKQSQRAPSAEGKANTVNDPQMGVSFTPPAGWKVQKQPNGYVLGSETYKGVIVIMPHDYSSLQEMSAEASEGIVDEESGTYLKPVSKFQAFGGNGLSGDFSGMYQGQMAKAYAIGLLSPLGGGVIIITAVEVKSYTSAYPQFVQAIASSLTFAQPQADTSLMQYFAGKFYSYSSGSTMSGSAGTERQVMLCPNGLFYDSSEFSASGQGDVEWGGVRNAGGTGRWKIRGNKTQGIITIIRPDGSMEEVEYRVTGEEGVILFNGIKFAYAGAPVCN